MQAAGKTARRFSLFYTVKKTESVLIFTDTTLVPALWVMKIYMLKEAEQNASLTQMISLPMPMHKMPLHRQKSLQVMI